MVIDTSAILAILFNESDAALFSEQISQDPIRLISAGLNFGDYFAYALANRSGEQLLFKSQEFIQTDLAIAIDLPTHN